MKGGYLMSVNKTEKIDCSANGEVLLEAADPVTVSIGILGRLGFKEEVESRFSLMIQK